MDFLRRTVYFRSFLFSAFVAYNSSRCAKRSMKISLLQTPFLQRRRMIPLKSMRPNCDTKSTDTFVYTTNLCVLNFNLSDFEYCLPKESIVYECSEVGKVKLETKTSRYWSSVSLVLSGTHPFLLSAPARK